MTTGRMHSGGQAVAQGEPERIDVREAVRKGLGYLREIYADATLPNLRVEEVELSDDEKRWLITYGFTAPEQQVEGDPFAAITGGPATTRGGREYKRVTLDARTGAPLSMTIREP